jgi:hypothetical protein
MDYGLIGPVFCELMSVGFVMTTLYAFTLTVGNKKLIGEQRYGLTLILYGPICPVCGI